MHLDLFVGDTHDVGRSSPEHFGRRDVSSGLGGDEFLSGLVVLPFGEVATIGVVRGFSESRPVQVLRLDRVHEACIPGDLRAVLLFAQGYAPALLLLGDVAAVRQMSTQCSQGQYMTGALLRTWSKLQ